MPELVCSTADRDARPRGRRPVASRRCARCYRWQPDPGGIIHIRGYGWLCTDDVTCDSTLGRHLAWIHAGAVFLETLVRRALEVTPGA